MRLTLIHSVVLASLTIGSVAFAQAPFYKQAKGELKIDVVEHSFPGKFAAGGEFAVSMKIKNAGDLALRGLLKVETTDADGKNVREFGRAEIDIPPAAVSNVELPLSIKGKLGADEKNRKIRVVLVKNNAGTIVCYNGAVSDKSDAPVAKPDASKVNAIAQIDYKIKFIKSLPAGEGAKWRKFMEDGGILIVPLIASPDDYAGASEFCGEKEMPKFKPQKGAAHSYDKQVNVGGTPLFDWPNPISPTLQAGNGRLSAGRNWEVVQNNYTVLRRVGRGALILSTHTCADTPKLRENILKQFNFENSGIRFVSCTHKYSKLEEFKGNYYHPELGGGKTTIKFKNINTATTNLYLAVRLTLNPLGNNKQSRSYMARRKPSTKLNEVLTFEVNVPPLDIHGEYQFLLELFEWEGKKRWVLEDRKITLPELIEVVPPDYRATVSTKRSDPNVHIGIKVNRKYIEMDGVKWTMVAKNSSGKEVASCNGKFLPGTKYATASLPVGIDAPAGKYDLEAVVEFPCGTKHTSKGEFFIVSPEKGQIIIDQDGFFLNEGEPYFPLGIYHCHTFDWNKPIDETGLTPKEMGFNWMQMWSWDWDHHLSLDREVVGRFVRGIDDPELYKKALDAVISTNKLMRKELEGVVICYEGFGFWEASFLEHPGPWGKYSYEYNERLPREIKLIADDPDQLVRMWYFADEAGGSFYQALGRAAETVRKYDKHFHPGFNLGNFPAVMSSDCGGNDIYVRYYGGLGEARDFANKIDAMRREYAPYNRRPFIVPQAFGQSKSQNSETPEWVRFESYISVIHGANGLGFYCWKQTGDWTGKHEQGMGWNPKTAHEVKKIISEIKVFQHALRVPGQKNFQSDDGMVDALLCGNEKTGRFLIMASVSELPVDTAMQIPGVAGMKLEPLFGTAKAKTVKGGGADGLDSISIKLPQWGTAVWRVK